MKMVKLQVAIGARHRHGVALLLVLLAVASAAVLTVAMLGSSSIRSAGVGNSADSLQAIYLADGGIDLGLYYLQYPQASGVSNVTGAHGDPHWPGVTNLSFNEAPGHRIDISVVNTAPRTFVLTSTGTITTASGQTISRKRVATVHREDGAVVSYALSVSDNVVLDANLRINGDVRTNGNLLARYGSVTGVIYSQNPTSDANRKKTPNRPPISVPSWNALTLTDEMGTYMLHGRRYNARSVLTAPGVTVSDNDALIINQVVLDDTQNPMNPGNVWYVPDDITIFGKLTIDGTLIVHDDIDVHGRLVAEANNGLPAVVVRDRLAIVNTGAVDVRGLLWVDKPVLGVGVTLTGRLDVVGAMMIDRCDGSVLRGFLGTATITHDPAALKLDYLDDRYDQPGQARVVRWH